MVHQPQQVSLPRFKPQQEADAPAMREPLRTLIGQLGRDFLHLATKHAGKLCHTFLTMPNLHHGEVATYRSLTTKYVHPKISITSVQRRLYDAPRDNI